MKGNALFFMHVRRSPRWKGVELRSFRIRFSHGDAEFAEVSQGGFKMTATKQGRESVRTQRIWQLAV